jgi:hypothetical protein
VKEEDEEVGQGLISPYSKVKREVVSGWSMSDIHGDEAPMKAEPVDLQYKTNK